MIRLSLVEAKRPPNRFLSLALDRIVATYFFDEDAPATREPYRREPIVALSLLFVSSRARCTKCGEEVAVYLYEGEDFETVANTRPCYGCGLRTESFRAATRVLEVLRERGPAPLPELLRRLGNVPGAEAIPALRVLGRAGLIEIAPEVDGEDFDLARRLGPFSVFVSRYES